jgi:hypothetical protein
MNQSDSTRRKIFLGMGIVGVLLVLDGVTVPLRTREMTTIPVHHLLHAGMAIGAGLLAMALAVKLPRQNRETTWWVVPAALAPIVGLFLMWPSEYAYLMSHPWLHLLDHLGIALCSVLAVFAAQAYVRGLGWPMLVLLVAMDAGAAGGFGITAGAGDQLCSSTLIGSTENLAANTATTGAQTTVPRPAANASQPATLHDLGRQLSQSLGCIACHHVDDTKAVGPSWKNLAGYPQKLTDGTTVIADYQFLRDAILYPEHLKLQGFPPGAMPSSYRAMLSGPQHADERELNALIWYINTLSDRSSPATQPPVPDEPGK